MAGEKRVLAVSLLTAAPARIAEDVDVGRPEGEPIKDAVIALALGLVIFCARFSGDDVAHGMDHAGIPGCSHADGLRKDRGVAARAQRRAGLRSMSDSREPEAGNGDGLVFKLVGFLVEGHAADQIVRALGG